MSKNATTTEVKDLPEVVEITDDETLDALDGIDEATIDAIEQRITERTAERLFLRSEEERKRTEALENDLRASEIANLPRPNVFRIPVLHPLTGALLGYEWKNGAGQIVEAPAGAY